MWSEILEAANYYKQTKTLKILLLIHQSQLSNYPNHSECCIFMHTYVYMYYM